MRIYILHDQLGEIQSVFQVELDPTTANLPRGPVWPRAGESVTEVPAEGIAVELTPLEIHENYRFDVERGELVRKSAEDEE